MITMPLKSAQKYAEKIASELAPYCERIEIAGSVRRRRPQCHDIDLVVMPSDWEGLRRRALLRASPITTGEEVFRLGTSIGVQVDIYRARRPVKELFELRPTNFGSLWLCRTGSAAHNIMLCQRAAAAGWHWQPHQGLFDSDGKLLACEREEDIFEALGMEFVAPEKREC